MFRNTSYINFRDLQEKQVPVVKGSLITNTWYHAVVDKVVDNFNLWRFGWERTIMPINVYKEPLSSYWRDEATGEYTKGCIVEKLASSYSSRKVFNEQI